MCPRPGIRGLEVTREFLAHFLSDGRIQDLWCSVETTDEEDAEEFDSTEAHREKWVLAKSRYEHVL